MKATDKIINEGYIDSLIRAMHTDINWIRNHPAEDADSIKLAASITDAPVFVGAAREPCISGDIGAYCKGMRDLTDFWAEFRRLKQEGQGD